MTKNELILSLLKMVQKWQRKREEYHLTAINWQRSSEASYNNKRYEQAKSERSQAIGYMADATNIYMCMCEVVRILYKFGIIKSPHIGYEEHHIQEIDEAIKKYTDKLEAGKDSDSYICMAGYEEVLKNDRSISDIL